MNVNVAFRSTVNSVKSFKRKACQRAFIIYLEICAFMSFDFYKIKQQIVLVLSVVFSKSFVAKLLVKKLSANF